MQSAANLVANEQWMRLSGVPPTAVAIAMAISPDVGSASTFEFELWHYASRDASRAHTGRATANTIITIITIIGLMSSLVAIALSRRHAETNRVLCWDAPDLLEVLLESAYLLNRSL